MAGLIRHLPPDPTERGLNGKVVGVRTGVREAGHEHVVIADDDVRYDDAGLTAVHRLLGRVDLVRPQNYFDPLPWHAWWDTGRTLLNRALGADYPGTLAVRRSTFLAMGGYDPDVLFENLELIRTVRAYDGTEAAPAWLYVRRLPRTARTSGANVSARRTTTWPSRLACCPRSRSCRDWWRRSRRGGPGCCWARRPGWSPWPRRVVVAPAAAGCFRLARRWQHRSGCWSAVCGWLAVAQRFLLGGVRYGDTRIRRAANPTPQRRRHR
ncbi:hypothetical protein NKG94_44570 [Micromonospora sp. M12]